ncbi:hypothetical protein GGF32_008252 [Allomyces javanicus]|nr:hypothetical protein GGF32_008252 [Allomyces javanicus]
MAATQARDNHAGGPPTTAAAAPALAAPTAPTGAVPVHGIAVAPPPVPPMGYVPGYPYPIYPLAAPPPGTPYALYPVPTGAPPGAYLPGAPPVGYLPPPPPAGAPAVGAPAPFPHDLVAVSLQPSKKTRVSQACTTCRRRKIKCSGGFPCQHCREFGLECAYAVPQKRGPKATAATPGPESSAASPPVSLPSSQSATPPSSNTPQRQNSSDTLSASPPSNHVGQAAAAASAAAAAANATTAPNRSSASPTNNDRTLSPTSPVTSLFNRLDQTPTSSATALNSAFTASVTKPSTQQDIVDIANNLTLLVTLDAEGNPRGFTNYGNSTGMHLLRGLPANANLDGANVYFSQIAHHRLTMAEMLRHRVWFPRYELLDLLIHLYFERVHHWFPMVNRRQIEASVEYIKSTLHPPASVPLRTTSHLHQHLLFIYAVCALPCALYEQELKMRLRVPYSRLLASHAKKLILDLYSAPAHHLTDVQATLLLSLYDTGIPSGNTWLCAGLAFRLALSLGLNLDPRSQPAIPTGRGPTPTPSLMPGMGREVSPDVLKLANCAPNIPSRMITNTVVFTLDRLSAASAGRPIMVQEEDVVLDLDTIMDTEENRTKYPDEAHMLLPQSSFWPYFVRWGEINGRILRAVNSFRYRRQQLPLALLPELHASLTQFRASIPPHLVFDTKAFPPAHTGLPVPQHALESAVLMFGYYSSIVYVYRPLVTMVITTNLHFAGQQPGGAETPSLLADDSFMRARAHLRPIVQRGVDDEDAAAAASNPPPPVCPLAAFRAVEAMAQGLVPPPTPELRLKNGYPVPPLFSQYVAIMEMAIQSITQIFVAIKHRMHLFYSTMLHQLGSTISAGRAIVAGGGNVVLVRSCLRELVVVLADISQTAPMALHTYHLCRVQLAQLDVIVAQEAPHLAHDGWHLELPPGVTPNVLDPEYEARRQADADAHRADMLEDTHLYAREVPELTDMYLALHEAAKLRAAAMNGDGASSSARADRDYPSFRASATPSAAMAAAAAAAAERTSTPARPLPHQFPLPAHVRHTVPPPASPAPTIASPAPAPVAAPPGSHEFPSSVLGVDVSLLAAPGEAPGLSVDALTELLREVDPPVEQPPAAPADVGVGLDAMDVVPPPVDDMMLPEFPGTFIEWAMQCLPDGFDLSAFADSNDEH